MFDCNLLPVRHGWLGIKNQFPSSYVPMTNDSVAEM